jgi:Holliday junction resolvase RusA-like endonuclease
MNRAIAAGSAQLSGVRFDGAVELRFVAWFHRPCRLLTRKYALNEWLWAPKTRNDVDNIAKLVMDCLVKLEVIVDDNRIVRLVGEKRYVPIGSLDEGVRMTVSPAPSPSDHRL